MVGEGVIEGVGVDVSGVTGVLVGTGSGVWVGGRGVVKGGSVAEGAGVGGGGVKVGGSPFRPPAPASSTIAATARVGSPAAPAGIWQPAANSASSSAREKQADCLVNRWNRGIKQEPVGSRAYLVVRRLPAFNASWLYHVRINPVYPVLHSVADSTNRLSTRLHKYVP